MAANFLTDKDYQKLNSYPEDISKEDVIKFFTLTTEDKQLINQCREDFNRLGFALQLGTLRFLGFVPDKFDLVPKLIVNYLCEQLSVEPDCIVSYGLVIKTKNRHLQQITAFLNFQKLDKIAENQLEQELIRSAFYHNSPKALLTFALDWLYKHKILRPGLIILGRIIVKALNQADKQLLEQLQTSIQSVGLENLDELLTSDENKKTKFGWLRESATVINPEQILENLEKLNYLQKLGVLDWKLPLSANKIKKMYKIAYACSNHELMRMVQFRRYPVLVAFLSQSYTQILDETLDMICNYLWDCHRKGNIAFEKEIREQYSGKIELIKTLKDICELAKTDELAFKEKYGEESLEKIITNCEQYLRPDNDKKWDYFAKRYSNIRKFIPKMLEVVPFEGNEQSLPVIKALNYIKKADKENKRKMQPHVPRDFIDPSWDNYVFEKMDISKKYYELCTLWELREQLRKRNVFVQKSEKYCNYQEVLLSEEEFEQQLPALESLNLSLDFSQKKQELTADWQEAVRMVLKTIRSRDANKFFEIIGDEIHLKADEALEVPESAKRLQEQIRQFLPDIDLQELIMEVGEQLGFTEFLKHINNDKPVQSGEGIVKNYVVLHANACNLNETDMERTTGLNRHQFSHHQQWYFTQEAVQKINDTLVNAQYRHPLTTHWGDGTMSSSDGQKYMVSVRSISSSLNSKYFFMKKGLNSYTWTADIFAQYGSKLISATEKEATYILDMILDNETELKIEQHTGDEGAYTDLIFALFDLFGLVFCPRLGNLQKKTLLSIVGAGDISKIRDIFSRPVNFGLIERNWREILRVVCSIKTGKVPCSVFVSKLQNTEQKNELLRALQEYGKLIKTTFIFKYIIDEELRHRIRKQLNKGESLHDLRQVILFGNETRIYKPKYENQALQVWCLTAVTNCVIYWNTIYIGKVLERMKKQGIEYDEDDLIYISPCRFEHINKYGKFEYDLDKVLKLIGKRELKMPSQIA